jgi:hypothetical protein
MIHAGYAQKCGGCGEDIEVGDTIGMVEGEWVCENCVDDAGGEDS